MQKLVWINSKGTEINLTSGDYGITEWEGFSACDVEVQTQNVPFQDGSVFLDALLNNRELSVTLAINDGKDLEKRYRLRRELISVLNPKLGEGYLIYTNDFISKRIKCLAQMPVFPTHNSDKAGTPKASLSWTACDPYWEDLEETVINTVLENQKLEIEQNGDLPTNVNIEIKSNNVSNLKINNLEIQDLTEYAKITTERGNKTAFSQTFNKEPILFNNEIFSAIKIDNDNYCLGGNGSFIIYNVLTNECKSILLEYGNYVEDIIKVGTDYYAVTTQDNLRPLNYSNNFYNGSVGSNSYILKSTDDCKTWVKIGELLNETSHRRGIIKIKYNNGKFYLLNRCRPASTNIIELYETEDFNTYTTYSFTMNCAHDIYIDNDICIVVGGDYLSGDYYSQAKYTTDFNTWSDLNIQFDLYYADEHRYFTNIIKCNDTFLIFTTHSTGNYAYSWSYPIFYSTDGINYNYKYFDTDQYRDTRNVYYDAERNNLEVLALYNIYLMRCLILDDETFLLKSFFKCNIQNCIVDNLFIGSSIQRVITYKGIETLFDFSQTNLNLSNIFYVGKIKEKYLFIETTSLNSNQIHIYYGEYGNLTLYTISNISIKNLDTVFETEEKIYISTGTGLWSYDGVQFISETGTFIEDINDKLCCSTFNGESIYFFTKNDESHISKIYMVNLKTKEKEIYTKSDTGVDKPMKMYYVSKYCVSLFYRHIQGASTYGFDGQMILNPINKTYSGVFNSASDIYTDMNNFNGWRYSIYVPFYNLTFLKIGTTPKIYISQNGINWLAFDNNNIDIKSFFYNKNQLFFNCSDKLYTTLNGLEIANYIDDNIKIAGVDENKNIISVKINYDIIKIFLQNYQNIISKLTNGCDLVLQLGKNEYMIYKTGGEGLITLSYRQKYIGV